MTALSRDAQLVLRAARLEIASTIATLAQSTRMRSGDVERAVRELHRAGLLRVASGAELGIPPDRCLFAWLPDRRPPSPVPESLGDVARGSSNRNRAPLPRDERDERDERILRHVARATEGLGRPVMISELLPRCGLSAMTLRRRIAALASAGRLRLTETVAGNHRATIHVSLPRGRSEAAA